MVAPVFIYLVKILSPITRLIQLLVNVFIRIISSRNREEDNVSGTDALRGAIEMHHDDGTVIKEDKDICRMKFII